MGAQEAVGALIEALRGALALEVRRAPPEHATLEAVLRQGQREACCALLAQALGPPAKEFGAKPRLDARAAKLVESLGGIRKEQCLYLKPDGAQQTIYAALWPWESDPDRITLRVGVHAGGGSPSS